MLIQTKLAESADQEDLMASGELPPVTHAWPGVNVTKVKNLVKDPVFAPTLFLIQARGLTGGAKKLLDKSWGVFMKAAQDHCKQKGYSENEFSAAFNIATGLMRLP